MAQAAREFVTRLTYKLASDAGLRQYTNGMQTARRATQQWQADTRRAYFNVSQTAAGSANRTQRVWQDAHGRMRTENGRFVRRVQLNFAALDKSYKALMGHMGRGLMTGAPMVGGAVAGAAALGGAKLLDVGKEYEGLIASLTTVTGSQAAANKEFARLEQFAAKTPYALNETVVAYNKMRALGLEPSERAMMSYGNTAGAMNKSLMDMVEAVADASTGEFERLKEFGIRSSKEGDRVKFTFQGVETEVGMNAKEIEGYLIKLGQTKFAGGMDRQAATIGGRMSTMADNFDALWRKIWLSGGNKVASDLVGWIGDLTARATPWITKQMPLWIARGRELVDNVTDFATKAFPIFMSGIREGVKLLPFIVTYLGGMTARMVGLKAIAAGTWLLNTIRMLKTLQWSMVLFNATAFLVPMAIGAALAAIAYLGYNVWKYVTQGEKGITGLRKSMPWLADLVQQLGERWKIIQPYVQILITKAWELITTVGQHLAPVLTWVLDKVFVGALMLIIKYWIFLFDQVKQAIDFWFPLLQGAIGDISQGFSDWKVNFENAYNFIVEKLKPLSDFFGALGSSVANAWASMTGGGGEAGPGGPNPLDDPNFPLSNKVAKQLVQNAYDVRSGAGRCLNGVWQAYSRTMKGTALNYYSAADAANGLKRDKRFRELQVTPEMLANPQYRQMLYGAIAVYDRESGFSKQHGHIEVWDTKAMKALYGTGAASLVRSRQNLAHARVFVPVDPNGGATVPMGAGNAAPVLQNHMQANVTINLGAGASPGAVGRAAQDGTTKALKNATQTQQKKTL